jgi:diguanylate cyclase (GGDEF)-like protein
MCIDLDRLESVNELYGREAGDQVLQVVARRLSASTRGEDTVGRIEDSGFLYLLMDFNDEKNVAMIADRFIRAIQVPCEISVDERKVELSVTISMGIAMFPKDGATAPALVQSAKVALKNAKRHNSRFLFAS